MNTYIRKATKGRLTVCDPLCPRGGTTAAKRAVGWFGTLRQTLDSHPDKRGKKKPPKVIFSHVETAWQWTRARQTWKMRRLFWGVRVRATIALSILSRDLKEEKRTGFKLLMMSKRLSSGHTQKTDREGSTGWATGSFRASAIIKERKKEEKSNAKHNGRG